MEREFWGGGSVDVLVASLKVTGCGLRVTGYGLLEKNKSFIYI